ncbi:MAG: glycosyltransferase family 2 protein [Myxococcota bacterium]
MTPDLSIVVLAYNEEENVEPVIDELGGWLDQHLPDVRVEILVVDDGSTDETRAAAARALAEREGTVLVHPANRGMGAGLKTGVRAARGAWVTFLPADGQIDPAAIQTLWNARTDADVVLSVYEDRDDGAARRVLSWGVRALILAVHGVRMHSDGPYLFRRTLFDASQLEPDTFFLNFEFPIRVLRAGLRTATVTISCRPRRAGVSKTARLSRVLDVGRDLVDLRRRRFREALRRL